MLRVVVVIAIAARVGHADPVRLEVISDHCDLALVERAVISLVGGAPFDPGAARAIRIDGTQLTAKPIARIWFDAGHGQLRGPRVVTAGTCQELVDSVALVVAMTLPHDAPVAQEADPDPRVERDRSDEQVDDLRAPRPPTSVRVLVGGAATSAGAHEQIALGVRWRRGAASLALAVHHDASERIALTRMGSIDVGRDEVALVPCLHRGAFGTCALAGVGVIRGAGAQLFNARSVVSPLAFAGLGASWEHDVTDDIGLRAAIDLDAVVATTVFSVDEMPVWRSPRIEAVAGFALLVHFL